MASAIRHSGNAMRLRTSYSGRRASRAGFTLIEIIVTIVIVGVIAGIVGLLAVQGATSYVAEQARGDLTTQGRVVIERMAREVRTIRSRTAVDIPTMGASTLTFTDLSGTAITYTLAGGSITRNGVALGGAGTATLSFTYLDSSEAPAISQAALWVIQIDVTFTTGGETQAFRTRVHPRSFV